VVTPDDHVFHIGNVHIQSASQKDHSKTMQKGKQFVNGGEVRVAAKEQSLNQHPSRKISQSNFKRAGLLFDKNH